MYSLLPLQQRTFGRICSAYASGARAVAVTAPCGSGKGVLAAYILAGVERKGRRGLLIEPRVELVDDQALVRLPRAGVTSVGVLSGSRERGNAEAAVQVCTLQTLFARDARPPADVVIWDEMHHVAAPSFRAVREAYASAFHIGFTATLCRSDGAALGSDFDTHVPGATVRELTDQGYLVPCEVIGPAERRKDLAEDPVAAYQRHSPTGRAVVFCKTVQHAENVAAAFNAAGITARAIEGEMPSSERAAALEAFERGEVSVVTNVHVLTEGFNCPPADTCILARGFSHEGAYLQAVGRVLRTSPGKTRALVIDLHGVSHELGLPDDDREWSLEGKAVKVAEGLEPIRQCAACGGVFRAALYRDATCPRCGAVKPALPDPAVRRAEIGRITTTHTAERRRAVLDGLRRTARERGYREGWVAMRWKLLYGRFPTRAEMGGAT